MSNSVKISVIKYQNPKKKVSLVVGMSAISSEMLGLVSC